MGQTNYRRCITCRRVGPKDSFWRVVRVYPSQTVQLDTGMGRSAYLCPNQDCLTMARRKNRIGRSLKKAIPDEIYNTLESRLKKSVF